MKTDNEMIGMFPIPVMASHIGREFTQEEKQFMMNLPTKLNQGNITTVDKNILDHPELKDLRDFVQSKIDVYFNDIICPASNASIYITQSWLNITEKNHYHHKHNHSNSYLSGVFYIDTHPSEDKIHFTSNNTNLWPLLIDQKEFNVFNSIDWWLPAQTGKILLFPSSLTHYVSPVQTDTQRVSISFNTFLRGDIGNADSAAGITLP
jgi:uncharacterized protein (TIGR02466 family)